MEWFSTSNSPSQWTYELRIDKEKLLTLTYLPQSETIRISADDEKRVFLVKREGFIRNRIVLRNEYGIRIGQLTHDGGQVKQGNIEISDQQFNYTLQNDFPAKVSVYKGGDTLTECDLPEISKNQTNSREILILTLCWYLAVAVKKPAIEYA